MNNYKEYDMHLKRKHSCMMENARGTGNELKNITFLDCTIKTDQVRTIHDEERP